MVNVESLFFELIQVALGNNCQRKAMKILITGVHGLFMTHGRGGKGEWLKDNKCCEGMQYN